MNNRAVWVPARGPKFVSLLLLILALAGVAIWAGVRVHALGNHAAVMVGVFPPHSNEDPLKTPARPHRVAACSDGLAAGYPCNQVDLLAYLSLEEIGGGSGNDIWGWTDPLSGREYALMGRSTGTAFVDIGDPANPVYLGDLPYHSRPSSWRDIKTYDNYALVVADGAGSHGLHSSVWPS